MTKAMQEFLAWLPMQKGKFRRDGLSIRTWENHCPLRVWTGHDLYLGAAENMGLSWREVCSIVYAADRTTSAERYDPKLRKQMLEALGLREVVL